MSERQKLKKDEENGQEGDIENKEDEVGCCTKFGHLIMVICSVEIF